LKREQLFCAPNVGSRGSAIATAPDIEGEIREEAIGKSGVSLFSLVARQRQMASSIVGALESWRDKGLIEDLLWEDFGVSRDLLPNSASDSVESDQESEEERAGFAALDRAYDLKSLEEGDNKYRALRDFLTAELLKKPQEKFVVFAFYRGTLKYLLRRLKADGVNATLIMGDMGAEKDKIIRSFASADGPSVLLSSEVDRVLIPSESLRLLPDSFL
jgi:hypothetical protein